MKPTEMDVIPHQRRIKELCNYVDMLPGDRTTTLTKDERRNIFFNTFPKTWRDAFKITAHDVTTSSIKTIED